MMLVLLLLVFVGMVFGVPARLVQVSRTPKYDSRLTYAQAEYFGQTKRRR